MKISLTDMWQRFLNAVNFNSTIDGKTEPHQRLRNKDLTDTAKEEIDTFWKDSYFEVLFLYLMAEKVIDDASYDLDVNKELLKLCADQELELSELRFLERENHELIEKNVNMVHGLKEKLDNL